MKIIKWNGRKNQFKGSVATLGVYDGVHRGHMKILEEVVIESRKSDAESVVATFEPHPSEVISGSPVPMILPRGEKHSILENSGIDYCLVIKFTRAFASKSPDDFVKEVLVDFLKVKWVIIGFNYVFGSGRRGNAELLSKLGIVHGFGVKTVKPVKIGGKTVSSTAIRELVSGGEISKANSFLGRPFSVRGTVVEGDGKGRGLGFPTANLETGRNLLVPRPGVYCGTCKLESSVYRAVLYAGYKPTFRRETSGMSLEAHLLNFSGSLYGRKVAFEIRERIRGDAAFKDEKELKEHISKDIERCLELIPQ